MKRTFAIPVLGASGICLTGACGPSTGEGSTDELAGAWELTELVDGQLVTELPRDTEISGATYQQFGSMVVAPDLRGAFSVFTDISDYYGSLSDSFTAVFTADVFASRTYSLSVRGDFNGIMTCTVQDEGPRADASRENDTLRCVNTGNSGTAFGLTARRYSDE